MSHGLPNTVTLYDKDGNPVQVGLRNGTYVMLVRDDSVASVLADILEELKQIREQLAEERR